MPLFSSTGHIPYRELKRLLAETKSPDELYQAIVNSPFRYKMETALLFLGIVVLLVVNEQTGTIDRIALSNTALAEETKKMSAKKFEEIRIPLDSPDNMIAQVIRTQKPEGTPDWAYLFTPELTPEQARFNQAGGGIGYSAVYPVNGKRLQGAMIFSYFQYPEQIGRPQRQFMLRYTRLVSEHLHTLD